MGLGESARDKEFRALFPLRYRVVENDEVNAFAQRTENQIIVYRGLLDFVESDDQLAFVIGHEIGHIFVGQMKKVELETLRKQMQAINPQIELTENMMDELLADFFGVAIIDCAGFDSDASVEVVRKFKELRDPEIRDTLLPWLLDQSRISADDAHLVEELRRDAVSYAAEEIRDGKLKLCEER
jgi:predicted Zn-dependent protease